jgi:beta-lactamase regulating signal transducer with metallopeptidase domain
MDFLRILGKNELWTIVSLTLLYSIVIGLFLAILTGTTLICTRKSKPQVRYVILVGLLTLFSISMIVITCLQFIGRSASIRNIVLSPNTMSATNDFYAIDYTDNVNLFMYYLSRYSTLIVFLWLLIMMVKGTKMLISLFELSYLKNNQSFGAGEFWESKTMALAGKIKLSKSIKIMQSGLVQIPLVIGHFKPVILIPLGMISAIRPQEIEMIILHELAHIKRLDFLVNLLQHFLELIFFFNPALIWLSTLIRKEREKCCDEMVLQHSGSKQNYIRALLSFQEFHNGTNRYAMAFAKESNLIGRVKRIAFQKNSTLNYIERALLAITILLICTAGIFKAANPDGSVYDTRITDASEVEFVGKKIFIKGSNSVMSRGIYGIGETTYYIEDGFGVVCIDCHIIHLFKDGAEIPARQVGAYRAKAAQLITYYKNIPTMPKRRTGVQLAGKVKNLNVNINRLQINLINDLLEKRLITSATGLYFKLNQQSLDVNGVIYSGASIRNFQTKYLPVPIQTLLYKYPVE